MADEGAYHPLKEMSRMNNKKQLDFQTIAVDFDGTLCYSK